MGCGASSGTAHADRLVDANGKKKPGSSFSASPLGNDLNDPSGRHAGASKRKGSNSVEDGTSDSPEHKILRRKLYLTYLSAMQRSRDDTTVELSGLTTRISDETVALWRAGLHGRLAMVEKQIVAVLNDEVVISVQPKGADVQATQDTSYTTRNLPPNTPLNTPAQVESTLSRWGATTTLPPLAGGSVSNRSITPASVSNRDASGLVNNTSMALDRSSPAASRSRNSRTESPALSALGSRIPHPPVPAPPLGADMNSPSSSEVVIADANPFLFSTEVVSFFPIATIDESRLSRDSVNVTTLLAAPGPNSTTVSDTDTLGVSGGNNNNNNNNPLTSAGNGSISVGNSNNNNASSGDYLNTSAAAKAQKGHSRKPDVEPTGENGADAIRNASSRRRLISFYEACAIDQSRVYAVGEEEEGYVPEADIASAVANLIPGDAASGCVTNVVPPPQRETSAQVDGRDGATPQFYYSSNIRKDLLWCGDRFASVLARRWLAFVVQAGRQISGTVEGQDSLGGISRVASNVQQINSPPDTSATAAMFQSAGARDPSATKQSKGGSGLPPLVGGGGGGNEERTGESATNRQRSNAVNNSRAASVSARVTANRVSPPMSPKAGSGAPNRFTFNDTFAGNDAAFNRNMYNASDVFSNGVPSVSVAANPLDAQNRVDVLIIHASMHAADPQALSRETSAGDQADSPATPSAAAGGNANPNSVAGRKKISPMLRVGEKTSSDWCDLVVAFIVPFRNLSDSFAVGILMSLRVMHVSTQQDYLRVCNILLSARSPGNAVHDAVFTAAKTLM